MISACLVSTRTVSFGALEYWKVFMCLEFSLLAHCHTFEAMDQVHALRDAVSASPEPRVGIEELQRRLCHVEREQRATCTNLKLTLSVVEEM